MSSLIGLYSASTSEYPVPGRFPYHPGQIVERVEVMRPTGRWIFNWNRMRLRLAPSKVLKPWWHRWAEFWANPRVTLPSTLGRLKTLFVPHPFGFAR